MIWWCAAHDSAVWRKGDTSPCRAYWLVKQVSDIEPSPCRMVEALLIVKENGEWPELFSVLERDFCDRLIEAAHDS